ncbi:MAG: phasin, PhaP [Rhodobacteraceae bacterium]|nr:phasin, PhaP [Paracoccaceae bacterium]
MTNTQDFTKVLKDVAGTFNVDNAAFGDAFKSTATLNEKLSGVALTAAEQSAAISSKWATDTLAKLTSVSKAKAEPADYATAISEFATVSAQVASEYLSAYTDIAKRAQLETVELLMAAGKDISEEAATAVKKASTKTPKKAA